MYFSRTLKQDTQYLQLCVSQKFKVNIKCLFKTFNGTLALSKAHLNKRVIFSVGSLFAVVLQSPQWSQHIVSDPPETNYQHVCCFCFIATFMYPVVRVSVCIIL